MLRMCLVQQCSCCDKLCVSLQGRSCAPASFLAVPWIVPSASRLTPTTVRSVSAGHGPRSANPLYVTSTVPLDTCTYSHPESTLHATPLYGKQAKVQAYPLGLACGTAGGSRKIKTSLRMWECSILQNGFGSTHLETEAQKRADYKRKAVLKFC